MLTLYTPAKKIFPERRKRKSAAFLGGNAVESGNNADSRPARARCARSVDRHRGGVIPQERLRPDDGQGSMAMKATDAHEDKWFSTAVVTIPQRSGARSLKLKSARSNGSDLEQHRP